MCFSPRQLEEFFGFVNYVELISWKKYWKFCVVEKKSLTSNHKEDVLSVQLLQEQSWTAQPNEGNTEHPITRLTREGCVFSVQLKPEKGLG